MNYPEIAKIGLGNVDPARLKKSIDILVEAKKLPRTPTVDEIFTTAFLPPVGGPAEEAVLSRDRAGRSSDRRGSGLSPDRNRREIGAATMDLKLEGRVAMITGPAKGMGAAITKAFAAEGARLALIGRDIAAIEPVAEAGASAGAEAIVVPCDLTDAGAMRRAAAETKEAYGGRIDILVNVAGGSGPVGKTGVETTPEEFDDIVTPQHERLLPHHARRAADHDRAALRQDRQCRRHLRHARARRPHGLFGLEMGAARHHQELRARGRPVQHQRQLRRARHGRRSALPRQGLRRHGEASRHHASRRRRERHAADYALKRVTVDTDVANACLFLASDVSRQITGVDLPVDGGWAML